VEPVLRSVLEAYETPDEDFVERSFREMLRRPPDDDARRRAVERLADGTLSRATFLHELAQKRTRRVLRVAEPFLQHFHDRDARVEPDQVR